MSASGCVLSALERQALALWGRDGRYRTAYFLCEEAGIALGPAEAALHKLRNAGFVTFRPRLGMPVYRINTAGRAMLARLDKPQVTTHMARPAPPVPINRLQWWQV